MSDRQVTILIAYVKGTQDMLLTCLASLARHKSGIPYTIRVITDTNGYGEALSITENITVEAVNLGTNPLSGSTMHGTLLDFAAKTVNTGYILTLDSDCFPVADGWLGKLMEMQDEGATLSGILWPWIPAPPEVDPLQIEYRIRRSHCWNNTQVACQLVKTSFLLDNNLSFTSGDDTGFGITEKVYQMNQTITGLLPSCCALPVGKLDPEMNRQKCVVYGDLIYHQGGASRQLQGAAIDPCNFYGEASERVFEEQGAEWILKEGNHHKYKMDREEEVAQFKMKTMFKQMIEYLKTHDSLFDPRVAFSI